MSEQPDAPAHLGPGTDVSAADLDPDAPVDRPESSDPDAYTDDGTLGGTGGDNAGGAG